MSEAREPDQADFDLESFIDLFDEALTSDDESVQKTLGHLMTIVALTRRHGNNEERARGPLRRLFEDVRNINNRLSRLEMDQRAKDRNPVYPSPGIAQPAGPYVWPHIQTSPGTAGQWPPPGYPPNTIWSGTGTSATSVTLGGTSASGATGTAIAERVEDLLKSSYKGSSVGANE